MVIKVTMKAEEINTILNSEKASLKLHPRG